MNESTERLQLEIRTLLTLAQDEIEENSGMTWEASDGYLIFAPKAIVRRQFEHLQAISQLVSIGYGSAAGPLLRPSCEELIWAKYLQSIPQSEAEELFACLVYDEVFRSLRAQDDYAGRAATRELGLFQYLENVNRGRSVHLERFRSLGRRLGWPDKVVQEATAPSTAWLAKATKEQSVYEYIYHGTSRYVHFSPNRLLRQVWINRQGNASISAVHFENYWAQFSLYWGLFLFLRTVEELGSFIELTQLSSAEAREILTKIGEFGRVPIITPQELAWFE